MSLDNKSAESRLIKEQSKRDNENYLYITLYNTGVGGQITFAVPKKELLDIIVFDNEAVGYYKTNGLVKSGIFDALPTKLIRDPNDQATLYRIVDLSVIKTDYDKDRYGID